LPPAPAPLRLARAAGNPEVAAKALEVIGEILAKPVGDENTRRTVRNGLPLAEVEAQLRKHYKGDV
jgi:hypothetical protein